MSRYILIFSFLLILTACGSGETPSAPQAEEFTRVVIQATSDVAEAATEVVPTPTATEVPATEVVPTATEVPATEAATAVPQPTDTSVPASNATEVTAATEVVVTEVAVPTDVPVTEAAVTEVAISDMPTPAQEVSVEALSIGLEQVVDGLSLPVAVVSAQDGSNRLFVVEKGGTIRIVEDGVLREQPFLDISDSVSGSSEQGLLGLAFEPQRPERFYVNYTDNGGITVITRYEVSDDPNVADLDSANIILTIYQPARNHNGGHVLFGPDGYLWIGTGDGGAANDVFENGQNKESLLGAMLRLDVSGDEGYSIPPDNPFVNGGGAAEIWAIGLRNPWRYSFDRATNELWIADVGQNKWEEVHKAASDIAELNYGWPIQEGTHCFSPTDCVPDGLLQPITEYDHSLGCSITGGNVYRGTAYPQMQGKYFFADYCTGLIWAINAANNTFTKPTLLLESGLQVSSFGEDEAGELYLTSYGNGAVYRVVGK